MKTLAIIVNYRTPELTIDCLHSLQGALEFSRGDAVAVVDGCSGDDSVERIGAAIEANGWERWVRLMPHETNGGFACANNVALREGLAADDPPDCFWLLNPDTLVAPDSLRALRDFLQQRPQAGIAGSRLRYESGAPQSASYRFPSIWTEVDVHLRLAVAARFMREHLSSNEEVETPVPTDWVCGASMLIRREVLEEIGLLDEGFFIYYEETDFCRRAQQSGWECWHVPASCVVHLGGQSTHADGPGSLLYRRPGYWFESRRRYFLKHHGAVYAAATDFASLASLTLWKLRRLIQRKPRRDPPGYFCDLLRHSVLIRGGSP